MDHMTPEEMGLFDNSETLSNLIAAPLRYLMKHEPEEQPQREPTPVKINEIDNINQADFDYEIQEEKQYRYNYLLDSDEATRVVEKALLKTNKKVIPGPVVSEKESSFEEFR